ncbi:endonuclease III [Actinobaculum sp. 352]|nr:endonuclease III [Actinobaculum sp. 313]RTE49227.1 endonuclease III [Actinobaculum sp. 352]
MSKKGELLPQRRSLGARRDNAEVMCRRLLALYPDAAATLDHSNAFELLVATVLSAQTTDVRVNTVTPELFRRYPDAEALAAAPHEDLEQILRPLGFFRAKARSCQALAAQLCEQFEGEVPPRLEDLVSLPGVGRKTANVVLGDAFGIPGITVDTHVGRLSRRWAWTRHRDPKKVERDLAELLPHSEWTVICHRMIAHGRQVCHARNPACSRCELADVCASFPLLSSRLSNSGGESH